MAISDYIKNSIGLAYADADKTILVDEINSGLAYVGKAPVGSLTSEAKWSVARIYKQGNIFETKYASSGGRDQIWDNRASLFGTPAFSNLNSIQFDGVNDYLAAPHSTDLNFERTNTFSVSMWVKLNTIAVTHFLIAKRENAGNVRGWQIGFTAGVGLTFILSSTNVGNRAFIQGPSLSIGVWYHLVFTYNGNSSTAGMKLYINSVSTAVTSAENTLTTTIQTSVATQIGSRDSAVANFLNGKSDDAAVYNIELNQSQVTEIYNSGIPLDVSQLGSGANLVSWWRMGDGDTYPTVLDHKGTNHMTMYNMNNSDIVTDVP